MVEITSNRVIIDSGMEVMILQEIKTTLEAKLARISPSQQE